MKRETETRRHRCRPGIGDEDLPNRSGEDRCAAQRAEEPASRAIGLTTAGGELVEKADRYVDRDPVESHVEDPLEGWHD